MQVPDLDVARQIAGESPLYARRLSIELLLVDHLDRMVGEVALADVAVPVKGQNLPRKSRLARFGLVALHNTEYHTFRNSRMSTPPERLRLPEGVRLPTDPRSTPAMDTSKGIGLTYDPTPERGGETNTLVAVAAAYVPEPDIPMADIMIRQVQGFGSVDQSGHSNDGLNNGVDWRQTLVRAWDGVAQQTPAFTLGIHTAAQTPWVAEVGLRASGDITGPIDPTSATMFPRPVEEYVALGAQLLRDSYDDVADALHFTQMPSGHWESIVPLGAGYPGMHE